MSPQKNDQVRSRKNVLLIAVDHWPGRLLGCNGRDDMLTGHLHGSDREWVKDGKLAGRPDKTFFFKPEYEHCGILKNRDLLLQRGIR